MNSPPRTGAWARDKERIARNVRRRRAQLIAFLGGCCAKCHAREKLEFDHPRGRSWQPRKLSRHNRIARYWADARAGNLRLLCRSCNGRDGAHRVNGARAERRRYEETAREAIEWRDVRAPPGDAPSDVLDDAPDDEHPPEQDNWTT